jgi:hypothetical protein
MKKTSLVVFVLQVFTLLFFVNFSQAATDKLPALNVKLTDVTVSGLSSGAFMTSQFYVANSEIMSGAGIVAGGPYLCARSWSFASNISNALGACMNPLTPSTGPNTDHLLSLTKELSDQNKIDSVENLKDDKIYLFSGQADETVRTMVMDQTYNYFVHLGISRDSIRYNKKVDAGHAFITDDSGDSQCDLTKSPFINDCDIYQAYNLLDFLYSGINKPTKKAKQKIYEFDQTEFIDSEYTSMSESGFLYIPESCEQGGCNLHVVYHGCLQGYTVIGDLYYDTLGYNEIADTNNLVLLYPQVQPSKKDPFNPQGCWDFWGYSQPKSSNPDFYTNEAPQLKAVRAMVDRLADPISTLAKE